MAAIIAPPPGYATAPVRSDRWPDPEASLELPPPSSRRPLGARLHPFDQTVGQTQTRTPTFFRARHLSAVGLVVEPEQMEHAVQHEDFDFLFDAVAELARLRSCSPQRNGEIAQ